MARAALRTGRIGSVRGPSVTPVSDEEHATGEVISSPARDHAEHVVARLQTSQRRLLPPAAVLIGVSGATGFLWGRSEVDWENAALPLAAATLIVLLVAFPALAWRNRIYVVTTRRIVLHRGLFARTRTELFLTREARVSIRRGPVQRLVGSGDVTVHTGSRGSVVLRDVPHAPLVGRAIADLIEHAVPEPLVRGYGADRHGGEA